MQYTHGLKPKVCDVGRGCTFILRNMSSKAYTPRHDRGKNRACLKGQCRGV